MTRRLTPVEYGDLQDGDTVTVETYRGRTATGPCRIDDQGFPRLLFDVIRAPDDSGAPRMVSAVRELDPLPAAVGSIMRGTRYDAIVTAVRAFPSVVDHHPWVGVRANTTTVLWLTDDEVSDFVPVYEVTA